MSLFEFLQILGGIKNLALEKIKAMIRGTLDIKRLEKNGFTHGKNFNAQQGVIIDPGHCWLIECGDNVTMAPYVHILAHDASTKIPLGYTKIGRVKIGNNVFIGAGSTILPGVTIGDNVIIGSMSLVSHDLLTAGVYAGNPCKKIMEYDVFLKKHKNKMATVPVFDGSYIIGCITEEKKRKMKDMLSDKNGYIL